MFLGTKIPIDFTERQIIESIQHLTSRQIAKTLNRSPRGIRDELKRGVGPDGIYKAISAQEYAIKKIAEGKKKVLSHIRSRKKVTIAIIDRISNIENDIKEILKILKIEKGQ